MRYIFYLILIYIVSVFGQIKSDQNQVSQLQLIETQMKYYPDSLELYEEYCELSLKEKKSLDEIYAFNFDLDTIFTKMKNSIQDTVSMYETQIRIYYNYQRFIYSKAEELSKELHKKNNNNDEISRISKISYDNYNIIRDNSYNLCLKLSNNCKDPFVRSWCESITEYKNYQIFLANLKINPAPLFTTKDIHGKTISLSTFRGKIVLLHFWSMYSQPSVSELNDLKKIYTQYSKNDFIIISINGDKLNTAIDESILKNFIKDMNLNWYQIADGNNREIYELYYVRNYPTLYLMNKEGFIIHYENELRGKNLFATFSKLFIKRD